MSILKGRFQSDADTAFRPQLTSLIDVMTILLVFLIKSFSVDGNLITPAQDLVLPVSTSEKRPQHQSSIEITKLGIISEGNVIVRISELENDSMLIVPLYDWMRVLNSVNKTTEHSSALMIQCDRDIEFSIVKKVMFSCSKAGFTDFSVLVIQEES